MQLGGREVRTQAGTCMLQHSTCTRLHHGDLSSEGGHGAFPYNESASSRASASLRAMWPQQVVVMPCKLQHVVTIGGVCAVSCR